MADTALLAVAGVSMAAPSSGDPDASPGRKNGGQNPSDHPARRKILQTLTQRPGSNITDLRNATGIGWGTLQHHLHVLKRARLVKGLVQGRSHRFFPAGPRNPRARAVALLRGGRTLELARTIVAKPGMRQKRLTRAIQMSRKVLRSIVGRLQEAGLIEETRDGRSRHYFPTKELIDIIDSLDEEPRAEGTRDPTLNGNA